VKYRPEIDGLRCLAVCAVVLYHAGIPGFSGGYVGVDVFFVISGYLITSIISREIEVGTFTFRDFYLRRIRRIFPALFLVLAVCLPFAWWLLTPGQLREFSQSASAATLFSSNVYFFLKSGYFGANAEELPLLHTWSLAVEEQFYLVFPLILLAFRRTGVVWVLTIASFVACLYFEHRAPLANFFLSPMRAWELFGGALLALDGKVRKHEFRALLGLVLLGTSVFFFDKHTSFPGFASLAPVLGSVMLIAFSPGTKVGRLLSSKPLVGIGLISYGFYLWHQPIFAFARVASDGPLSRWTYLGLIGLALVASYLSWKYVEVPARRAQWRRVFPLAATVSVCFLSAGVAGHLNGGFPSRFDSRDLMLSATAKPSPKRSECHAEGRGFHPCVYFGKDPQWAVLGDSHAVEPAFAIAESTGSVLHLSFSGCQPALLFESNVPGCSEWLRQSVQFLQESKVRNVLVAFRHSYHLYGDQTKAYPEIPNDAPRFLTNIDPDLARRAYWASFRALIIKLIESGKTVYVLGPIPELPQSIERYVYGHKTNVGTSSGYFDRRNAAVLKALDDLPRDVVRIDAKRAFCDHVACYPIIDGSAMYFDDNHLSVAGAERLVASMQGREIHASNNRRRLLR
jgi:peptidoglycan/LPS O-acetylase OafA/YrhL